MSTSLTIALDAMGGDKAPAIVVKGANIARQRHPEARFILYGRQAEIEPHLAKLTQLAKVCEVIHTDERVASDTKPSVALRSGRQSSMRLAINAVKGAEADAVVSAGNTGALMAMSKFVLRTLPGIDRPAIASFFPTHRGESVMLDLGANVQCDAGNLVDFAIMGRAFARAVLGLPKPTHALLNVGSEEIKGHESLQEARSLLAQIDPEGFKGYVEGDDLSRGTVDVIVTDGFTGNVALKTAEGTAKLISEYLNRTFRSSLFASLGYLLARQAMQKLRKRLDPRRYNGAVFLGLNGIVVKSHGGSDALGFAHAVSVAIDMVKNRVNETIAKDCAEATTPMGDAKAVAS
ncbi:MAG: phosphate acyltransferase PlsX [Rhodospirillales bacterium]